MKYLAELREGQRCVHTLVAPEFTDTFDVIVCGLGTAGSLAALFLAEKGLSVLGIEAFTCVGGTHTAGGIIGHYFGCRGGRHEQLDREVVDFTQRYTHTTAESRKFLAEEALWKSGAQILYEASVCGVYLEENRVIGVKVAAEWGTAAYGATLVLDCTAEAVVAVMAGCETEMGRETDGQMQPYSLVSMVFDGTSYKHTNVDFGRVDQTDPAALSQAILFARSYPIEEEHSDVELIAQMPMLGIREGRRIIAEETIRLEDLFAGKQADTPAFYAYADFDKHGWDSAFDGETLGDWTIGANLGAYVVSVAVPYKTILPKGYDGILVPCRGLGVDRNVSCCVRMNYDMKKIAEVAAQWAYLAISQGKSLREIPYGQLREPLTESGCLKESDDRGCRVDGYLNWDGTRLVKRAVQWITDPARLSAVLETETPGEAIWSARLLGDRALPTLKALLTSPNENTRKHAAFALAMLHSTEGQAVLREMVVSRDGLMLKDCRKNNNLRGCMAIYWLGRLADRTIAEELIGLICDEKEINREVYRQTHLQTTRYPIADYNNIYFQFLSQSVMALVRIGDKHRDLRPRIANAFVKAFSSDEYYWRITKRPEQSSEGNIARTVKNIAFAATQKWNSG